MSSPVVLTGDSLTIEQVVAVARGFVPVAIDPKAAKRADASRATVEAMMRSGQPVYGINTGFGRLAHIRIAQDDLRALQRNLILSHVAGVGNALAEDVVRAMMLLRANVLLRPTSGVRSRVATTLTEALNAEIHPIVPEQGSVGASGDLAPLAHIAYAMMGEGDVLRGRGKGEAGRVPAATALADVGIDPVVFEAKEGLAFINGTQAQTAVLALLVHDARNLVRTATGAAAMSLESVLGTPVPFDERIHASRPHPGQGRVAEWLREHLADSEIRESHRENDPRVQDAYSFRCAPQVHGAVLDAVDYATGIAMVDLNASTDNPLVFDDEILSGGNFHGQPVALALDVLSIALSTLAGIAERRLERLVNPELSQGLPAFLAVSPGLHSGLMMAQITAAALVAETRTLATPASVQSIPTDGNQEDVVPMGMAAATKARRILAAVQRVVACELIAGARGIDLRRPLKAGKGVEALHLRVRRVVEPLEADRPLTPDIEALAGLIARESLT